MDSDQEQAKVEAERAVTRSGYRKLMDQIADKEEDIVDVNGENNQLLQFLQNNEELYDKVNAPQEAVMDAVVVKQLSKLCKKQAENMSTNINEFKSDEFATIFKIKMMNDDRPLSAKKWIKFGKNIKPYFQRSPTLSYMFGALDVVAPPPKERKQRETKARQATKVKELKETQAAVVTDTQTSANQTDVIVTHVFRSLVRKFKENQQQPINYFKFVINPKCFGTSVENMFHVSFLVKEGKCGITICSDTGAPLIQPLAAKQLEKLQRENDDRRNQVVLSFNMNDWAKLIKKYDIRETMIQPVS